MKTYFRYLSQIFNTLLKVAQLAALLWIGYELHSIAQDVNAEPSMDDTTTVQLTDISEKLDLLTRLVAMR